MPSSPLFSRLSLVLSVLALGVSSMAWVVRSQASRPADPAQPTGDVEALEQRMAALERQIEAMRVGLVVRSATQVKGAPALAPAAAAPAPAIGDLDRRVAQLEQLAAAIRERQAGGRPLTPEQMAAATRTVLDRQASVEERAAALTKLRPNDGRADGRTHEVVLAALELLEKSEMPPRMRANMVRDLDKLRDPALKDPIVGILTRDPDGRTRREAVETLAVFYDDPQVRGLVERLKDTDPEQEVRAQAVKQLGRWQSARNSP
jgi:hypothetical protein